MATTALFLPFPNENLIRHEGPLTLSPTDRRADRRSPDSTLTTPDAAGLDKLASLAAARAGGRARALQPLAFPGFESVRPTALRPGASRTLRPFGWRLGRLAGGE